MTSTKIIILTFKKSYMKEFLFFGLFLFSFINICTGQQNKTDSLKNIIKHNKTSFEVYNELAWEYAKSDPDSLNYYSNLSKKYIHKEVQKGQLYVLKGAYYLLIQNFEKSKQENKKAISIAKIYSDYRTLGSAYSNLSTIARFEGKLNDCKNLLDLSLKNRIAAKKISKIADTYMNYAAYYGTINDSKNAIKYFEKALALIPANEQERIIPILNNIGFLYTNMDEMEKSIEYFQKCEGILKKINFKSKFSSTLYLNWGNAFLKLKKFSSAEEKLQKSLQYNPEPSEQAGIFANLAEIKIEQGKYEKAKPYIEKAITIDTKMENINGLASDYYLLGKIAQNGNKNYHIAENYYKQSLKMYEETKDSINVLMIYENLIRNSFSKNNDIGVNSVFDKYIDLKNILTEKEKLKSVFELDTKYRTAEKDAKLKTQQFELEKEKSNRNMTMGGIACLLLLLGGSFLFYRNQQRQKELQSKNDLLLLKQNMNKMELQNLNQQLNPHEVKNMMSALAPEILKSSPEAYQLLVKMINLIKSSLNSGSVTDSVANQIGQIEDYVNLEKKILSTPLHFTVENNVSEKVQIPRLLLKNLVENAIKHGIHGKEDGGNVKVMLSQNDGWIHISVEDNGINRSWKIAVNKGIGISTYKNLFEILNKKNNGQASFQILDKNPGTRVIVKIPENYNYS